MCCGVVLPATPPVGGRPFHPRPRKAGRVTREMRKKESRGIGRDRRVAVRTEVDVLSCLERLGFAIGLVVFGLYDSGI